MNAPRMVNWWTPTGWEWRPVPNAFHAYEELSDAASPRLSDFGYREYAKAGEDGFDVVTYRTDGCEGEDGHLYVQVDLHACYVLELFVAEAFIVPFFLDRGLSLFERARRLNSPNMARALTAWVRHGHGTKTIDQWGERDHEELEHEETRARAQRRRREEQQAERRRNDAAGKA